MVILADSSAWIAYLRRDGSPENVAMRQLLTDGQIATTEAVIFEILAGGRSERHLSSLQGLLARAVLLASEPADWREAAMLYRVCRANGKTVRSPLDCLISAVAIRHDVAVLHRDRDFAALAAHTPVRIHTP